jgi:uncharacterized YccA/Bax inhibitor family protein
MRRRRHHLLVILSIVSLAIAGCSLVVDFDRSLLVDAGIDAGQGGAGGAGGEPSDPAVEADAD